MNNSIKLKVLVLLFASSFLFSGCFTQRHVVGDGSQSGQVEEVRQWFVLWGLVPINEVHSADMADGARNYEVKTEHNALDVIIGVFTSWITIYPRTVTVTR